MLITKEVAMTWTHANKKYFIEKGYIFTKYNDVFMCKVDDLSPKSAKEVECTCDYCGEKITKKYNKYLKGKEIVFKDCCESCAPLKTRDIMESKYSNRNYNTLVGQKTFKKYNDSLKIKFLYKLMNSAKSKGYVLLPFVYTNAKEKVGFFCIHHPELGLQYSTFYNISIAKDNCAACIGEKSSKRQTFTYDQVKNIVEANGLNKLVSTTYIKAGDRNLEILCGLCGENIFVTSLNKFSRGHTVCKECRKKLAYGKTSPHWKGGITDIRNYLRGAISKWKFDSLLSANFTCDISGEGGYLEVHHLNKSFKDIVEETFTCTNIPIRASIGEYTQEQLDILSDICLKLHYKYGLGVCIKRALHLDFHKKYGHFNNSSKQYYDFKNEYIEQIII